MKGIVAVIPQPAEERHAPCRHRCFKLTSGQAVDLDQEQARLLACALARRQTQMANRPFVAAKPPAKAMPEGFNGGKHD